MRAGKRRARIEDAAISLEIVRHENLESWRGCGDNRASTAAGEIKSSVGKDRRCINLSGRRIEPLLIDRLAILRVEAIDVFQTCRLIENYFQQPLYVLRVHSNISSSAYAKKATP